FLSLIPGAISAIASLFK
uniref:Peptide Ctry2801 n=1 Tax=Chaerilus tryznai TaxID=1464547 RepID=NDB4W_CHATY|nr:RecName: Full=Peptide Ctry2801 [Chaerilus tryznai]